jgi:hypothetical protein
MKLAYSSQILEGSIRLARITNYLANKGPACTYKGGREVEVSKQTVENEEEDLLLKVSESHRDMKSVNGTDNVL